MQKLDLSQRINEFEPYTLAAKPQVSELPPHLKELKQQFSKLSFVDCARFCSKIASISNSPLDIPPIFELYGFRYNEQMQLVASAVLATPLEFQKWAAEKELGIRDLAPLNLLQQLGEHAISLSDAHDLLTQLAQLTPSKSEGVKTLEILIELMLMQKSLQELSPRTAPLKETFSLWSERLLKMRNPLSQNYDESQAKQVRALAWPAHVAARWVRVGDMGGIEVKFHATSLEEYRKFVDSLQNRSEDVTKIWSNLL